MTGLVKSAVGKIIKPNIPGSSPFERRAPEIATQQQMAAAQEQQIAKQEKQLTAERTDLAERTMASLRARRRGGLRALLSEERPDELGVMTSKLGGGT